MFLGWDVLAWDVLYVHPIPCQLLLFRAQTLNMIQKTRSISSGQQAGQDGWEVCGRPLSLLSENSWYQVLPETLNGFISPPISRPADVYFLATRLC